MPFEKGHKHYPRRPDPDDGEVIEQAERRGRTRDEAGRFADETAPVLPITMPDLSTNWGLRLRRWLCAQWPHLQDGPNLVGKVRGWIIDPGYWFNRCGDCALLARRYLRENEPCPEVQVVFLFLGGDRAKSNAAHLYQEVARWGQRSGAKSLSIAVAHSDIGKADLVDMLQQAAPLIDPPEIVDDYLYRIAD